MNRDSSPAHWFYAHEGQSFGPYSFGELQELLNTGTITFETQIAQSGSDEWHPFAHYLTPPALASAESRAGEESGHEQTPSSKQPRRSASKRAQAIHDAEDRRQRTIRKGCRGCFILFVALVALTMLLIHWMTAEVKLSPAELNDPQAGVEKLMKAVYGFRLREVEVNRITAGDVGLGRLNVYVRVNAGMDSKRGLEFKMIDAYKALYQSGLPIWETTIWNYEKLSDPYGKESEEIVYKTTLHSREASRINWKNIAGVSFDSLWEVNFLHPVLQKP